MSGPASRRITGAGTTDAAWRAWPVLATAPALELGGVRRVLVVAPHPDDEVLGAGGTVALLHAAGTEVRVLALTDGEASHPAAAVDPAALARRRAAETDDALRRLLGRAPLVDRLALPDGALTGLEERIAASVTARLQPGDWCLAPYRDDGHPDHEASFRAAASACATIGARLVEYAIWLWHWAAPGESSVPWSDARRVELPSDVYARKRDAVGAFRSQLEPVGPGTSGAAILPAAVRARFERPWEVLFT